MISRFLRRVVKNRFRSQLPNKLDQKRNRDKFAIWLEQNPTGTFEQFYADSVVQALAGEKIHSSLGPAIKPGKLQTARRIVKAWRSCGVRPSDNVVDYGCGTLRLGRLLIEFLDADRYIGLDIDDRILDAGRSQLSADLIALKRPRLEVIRPPGDPNGSAQRACCNMFHPPNSTGFSTIYRASFWPAPPVYSA